MVHAILVTHEGARWLPEVRRSFDALTRKPDSLIIVDTGSRDRSRELVAGMTSTILLAEHDDGFGDAIALAIEQLPPAIDRTTEWIWLLHDDFAPSPDCLEQLLSAVDDAPSVGIAGPKLRGWHDRSHLLEVGVSIAGNGVRWTGLDRGERDQGQHDEIRDVLAVSTAGMLVRRDVWEELEGLDPNLSLFRDDVDLGWRANVAGHRVINVPQAIGLHAEAAANERRRIDVHGALHRPHLLDRRHAAYVLLVNCSPSRLPLVFLRLILSALLRAVGYLFAKLPGYSADEIGGLVLLLSRPDLLRQARRARRQRRLLPARTVRPYLAPLGSQTRSAIERIRTLILGGFEPFMSPSSSVLTPIDDDEEFIPAEEPLLRRVIARPGVALCLGLLVLALVAARQRFGPLSGAALLPSPDGARDVISLYTQSWHSVGLGSSVPSAAWLPLLSLASILTAGDIPLLVTALVVLGVPLAGILMYVLLRPKVEHHVYAAAGAALYALSPVVLTAVNGGRIGTLVSALLLPVLLRMVEPLLSFMGLMAASWRRIWAVTALFGVMVAFTPPFFVIALILAFVWLVLHPRETWAYPRIAAPIVGAFLLNLPWSASALLHPTRWMMEPGLPLAGGTPATLLTLNPGGIGAPPLWIGGALLGVALLLASVTVRWSSDWMYIVTGFGVLSAAMVLAVPTFVQRQSGVEVRLWLGAPLLLVTAVFIVAAVQRIEGVLASLRRSQLGSTHVVMAVLGILVTVSLVLSAGWFGLARNAALSTDREPVLPAFVAELSATPDQARTLVLDASESQVKFALLRGRELRLGEADIAREVPTEFIKTVETLLAGGNQGTVDRLGRYGVGFILMSQPVDQDLARTLDGVGGLTRLSVTDGRILWSVTTVTARVRIIDEAGNVTGLRNDTSSLTFNAPSPGVIVLAETADRSWSATSDGVRLVPVSRDDGLQAFALDKAGEVVISHNSVGHRTGLTVAIIAAVLLLFLVTPSGRRLGERPDAEVS